MFDSPLQFTKNVSSQCITKKRIATDSYFIMHRYQYKQPTTKWRECLHAINFYCIVS